MKAQWSGYIGADCANCGRQRLELFIDSEEKAVGVRCEKCFSVWPLDAGSITQSPMERPYFACEKETADG